MVSSKETTPAAYLASLPPDVIGDIVASTSVDRRIEAAEAARQRKTLRARA